MIADLLPTALPADVLALQATRKTAMAKISFHADRLSSVMDIDSECAAISNSPR